MKLRDYQIRCLQLIRECVLRGIKRMILQLATGGGKTVIAVALILLARQQGKRILFVAHRVELIDQAVAKLIQWGVQESEIGVIRGGDPRLRPGAPIQVASVQSMRDLPPADVVIIDEAHRSAATSYDKIFEAYTEALFFGLTATPERLDGRPLDMFQEIIVVTQPHELAIQGHIAAPIIYGVRDDELPDLSGVKVSGGDYNQKQLAEAVKARKLIGSIPDHWMARAEGRLTVVFCVDIEHSKQVCASFRERNIPFEHADGKTPEKQRRALITKLRNREILGVCQVDLWIEGVDIPEVKCGVLARPTQSLTIFLQSIGRCLRPYNNEVPLILDHAGNTLMHGMPLEPRKYSLTGRMKRLKGTQISHSCPLCYRGLPVDVPMCPDCRVPIPGAPTEEEGSGGKQRVVRTEDGTLVELPQDEASIRLMFWNRTVRKAKEMGFELGWCKAQFKERFDGWPPPAWTVGVSTASHEADDPTRRTQLNKLRAIAYKQGKDEGWVSHRYRTMYGEEPSALSHREGSRVIRRSQPITTSTTTDEPIETHEL